MLYAMHACTHAHRNLTPPALHMPNTTAIEAHVATAGCCRSMCSSTIHQMVCGGLQPQLTSHRTHAYSKCHPTWHCPWPTQTLRCVPVAIMIVIGCGTFGLHCRMFCSMR